MSNGIGFFATFSISYFYETMLGNAAEPVG